MPSLTIQSLGAHRWRIHATAVQFEGDGLLILGTPASGKTTLAAYFLEKGAALIGDDYLIITREGGQLIASPPPNIAGVLALRDRPLLQIDYLARAPLTHAICLSEYSQDLCTYTGIALADYPVPQEGVAVGAARYATHAQQQGAALAPDWIAKNISFH